MPREKRLRYRSLHYKEMLIFLNLFYEVYQNPMWYRFNITKKIHIFDWLKLFQAYVACKIIEDTFGYVCVRALESALGLKTRATAKSRVKKLIKNGLMVYTGQVGKEKHYHLTTKDTFTNWYPQAWLAEYQRLMGLGLRIPTIKYIDKIRPKTDGISSKQQAGIPK